MKLGRALGEFTVIVVGVLVARTYDFCQYPGHQASAVAALDSLVVALER